MPNAKKPIVTRKFMLDLADRIYNPKTRRYIRLCSGTLQSISCKGKTVHCGLGELYFAVTGRSPFADGANETRVIQTVFELSTIPTERAKRLAKAVSRIQKLPLSKDTIDRLTFTLKSTADILREEESSFRVALDSIPGVNDGCGSSGVCTADVYRKRARLVAKQLRHAASFLPA